MGSLTKGIVLGVVAMLLLGIAAWLTVAYTGAYNVAATDTHADAVRWTFEKTMRRSIAARAGEVRLPQPFSEELIARGAGHYADTCAHCHGAPGTEPAPWSRGMRPEPPHLMEAASDWSAEEIHWIVTNGIKMTGMPAFGPHHNPEEIAAITAFVTKLPGLSPEEYRTLTGGTHGRGNGAASPPADPAREAPAGGN